MPSEVGCRLRLGVDSAVGVGMGEAHTGRTQTHIKHSHPFPLTTSRVKVTGLERAHGEGHVFVRASCSVGEFQSNLASFSGFQALQALDLGVKAQIGHQWLVKMTTSGASNPCFRR